MFHLSDRCAMLRDEIVNKKDYLRQFCAQHAVYYALGMADCAGKGYGNAEILAHAVGHVMRNFYPLIAPGERIVGYNWGDGMPYHEYYVPTDDEDGREIVRCNHVPEDVAARYWELRHSPGVDCGFRWKAHEAQSEAEIWSGQEWAAVGQCVDSNHSVIALSQVVDLGFEGLLQKVEHYRALNGDCDLYRAMEEFCRAGCLMGEKYAAQAQRLLDEGDPAYDQADLKEIISNCQTVPRHGAQTFAQAVQALLFAHIVNTWEDHINANSLGHLDQILYPYYRRDIDNGTLTREQAFELICCLWIKLYRDYDVQQSCIGGTDQNGKSLVNELSYLMLDATEQLGFVRCLSVRFGQSTEPAFLRRALEVVGHLQKGVPFFFNDDVMIPALVDAGIPFEDACDYTQIGCVETVIPGKSNPHAVSGVVNLLKALEYTLNDGRSMLHPECLIGLQTGSLDAFPTFDSLLEALKAQIGRIMDLVCGKIKKMVAVSAVVSPRPYKSLLTEGCLESARDFNDNGALYDYHQISTGGIPNLADSLAVIKKFVYEDKKYTLCELKAILEANFPDEAVRMEFVRKAPKFGNDIAEVDEIAATLTNYACDALQDCSRKYGIPFHAQPFTFLWMVDHGRTSIASLDGRHTGEIIAYSVSPMQGRDFSGLTALLNSISCLPTKRTPGTTSAIVEIDPKLFNDHNLDMLTDILFAAAARGLSNVQFNTIDADMLIDAKKHPEKYNNLAVRVSGFSQKFNLISPDLQDHIIARTKHACL